MLRDAAARRLDQLEALPRDIGRRIQALEEYDFMEPIARERFQALTDRLRRQTLDRFVDGLSQAIQGTTPEELQANREMVRDLNSLLEERLDGREPSQDQVDDFLSKHGGFFPGARTLDDIVEQLTQRMAAMAVAPAVDDAAAAGGAAVDDGRAPARRPAPLGPRPARREHGPADARRPRRGLRAERRGGRSAWSRRSSRSAGSRRWTRWRTRSPGSRRPATWHRIDREALRELVGEDAVRDLDALDDLATRLEQAGYLTRRGDRLELTPRGSRRIGQKVLDDLFARLSRDAFGGHRIDRGGRGGEREETDQAVRVRRPVPSRHPGHDRERDPAPGERAGDPGHRRAIGLVGRRLPGLPDRAADPLVDRAPRRHEPLDAAARLLRRRQEGRGRARHADPDPVPARRPRVIGFAYYARELRPEALAELTWHGYEYGTNLQHGLMLARRFLDRHHGGARQIVVITDGEPTAHFEGGQVEFSYPPTRRTIQETLREVQRCTRDGITINTFMLERSRALAEFVALMTRLNRGRAFYATPERLGEYVLVDFVSRRSKVVA